jgi:two-component system, NtrC family, response regulator
MVKPNLLIVDDDEDICKQMKWALADEYEVLLAGNRESALATFREQRPDAVLLDLGLPPRPNSPDEGFQALEEILTANPLTKVIIISGQGDKENAMQAVGRGAYDFLHKPIDTDALKMILVRAFHVAKLEREFRAMQAQVSQEGFEGMLGTSTAMQQIFSAIRKVATTDAPVLLLGESGTGKEMAAQAIHRRSARRDGPFVAINCAAIPETLLESELFGHEKGSFTGAHMQRKGRIEMANGGTLFLDEIGELPRPLQVKLLRFLQEQRLVRVGGRQEIETDVRIVSATSANLEKAIKEATFREDLYYRLAVVVVRIPPLREREGDIQLLARAFLQRFAAEHQREKLTFNHKALQSLDAHDWPGNVRELENRVKRAVIMADGKQVTAPDLELGATATGYRGANLKEAREAVEKDLILRALARNKGKISRASDDLGVSRPTLYEMMDKLGIKRE